MSQSRVLIIEDERHVARLIEYFLAKAGYTVASVDAAEKGLDALNLNRPDALILDLVLPGMSGLEFLSVLRKDPSFADLKVIVLTAHWFASDDQTILNAGANAHCSKPVSPTALIKILTDLGIGPPISTGE